MSRWPMHCASCNRLSLPEFLQTRTSLRCNIYSRRLTVICRLQQRVFCPRRIHIQSRHSIQLSLPDSTLLAFLFSPSAVNLVASFSPACNRLSVPLLDNKLLRILLLQNRRISRLASEHTSPSQEVQQRSPATSICALMPFALSLILQRASQRVQHKSSALVLHLPTPEAGSPVQLAHLLVPVFLSLMCVCAGRSWVPTSRSIAASASHLTLRCTNSRITPDLATSRNLQIRQHLRYSAQSCTASERPHPAPRSTMFCSR